MTPNEYLDAAKTALKLSTDYQLAKAIRIPRNTLAAIRKRNRKIDLETAYRLAITLQMDPSTVVADLEAQRTQNEARKAFFESFTSRAGKAAAIACTLVSLFTGGSGKGNAAPGGGMEPSTCNV